MNFRVEAKAHRIRAEYRSKKRLKRKLDPLEESTLAFFSFHDPG
jgi:hypothetical protein